MAIRRLQALTKQFNPDCLCVAETKHSNASVDLSSFGFTSVFETPAVGIHGGLVVAFKLGVHVEFLYSDANLYNLIICSDPPEHPWLLSLIYDPPYWH